MRLPIALALLLLTQTGAARADFALTVDQDTASTLAFHCSIKDGRSVVDNGTLQTEGADTWFIEKYGDFRFDAATGKLTVSTQQTDWVLLRDGNANWDLIAHLPGEDPVFNILRIEVWHTPILFTMTDGTSFYSGICEAN